MKQPASVDAELRNVGRAAEPPHHQPQFTNFPPHFRHARLLNLPISEQAAQQLGGACVANA